MDKYNKEKRSKSLLQKYQEEAIGHLKKKSKQFLAISQLLALCSGTAQPCHAFRRSISPL
jgi:hypothetical protein